MKRQHIWVFLGFLSITSAFCLPMLLAKSPSPMRAVKIEISLDGKTILKRGTGDNGSPDADQVWGYLDGLGMIATHDFPDFDPENDGGEIVINGDIQVKINSGGQVNLRQLALNYRDDVDRERHWSLPEGWVEAHFPRRLISRRLASRLNNPRLAD